MPDPFRLLRRLLRRPAPRVVPTPAQWTKAEQALPFLGWRLPEERLALRELAAAFLTEKEFYGANGLELTDSILMNIALQAALPILHLGLSAYQGWVGVVVYPGDFCIPRQEMDEDGVVHEYTDIVCGEAWEDGPVLLGWQGEAGDDPTINVILHEFAHKLDMADGTANGCPPLPPHLSRTRWQSAFTAAYHDFQRRCDAVDDGLDDPCDLPLDPYAAEHPAEFFAVASEAFFIDPHPLAAAYPAVYQLLREYYQQHPAAFAPPAHHRPC